MLHGPTWQGGSGSRSKKRSAAQGHQQAKGKASEKVEIPGVGFSKGDSAPQLVLSKDFREVTGDKVSGTERSPLLLLPSLPDVLALKCGRACRDTAWPELWRGLWEGTGTGSARSSRLTKQRATSGA